LVLDKFSQAELAFIAARYRLSFPVPVLYFVAFARVQNRNDLHGLLLLSDLPTRITTPPLAPKNLLHRNLTRTLVRASPATLAEGLKTRATICT
jgi:hypothetical protein